MSNPNKNKGKSFEREVCKVFESVYKLTFQRVPNSGAFVGQSNASRLVGMSLNQQLINRGDIIPPDELNHLAIECKARKEFAFHQLFTQSKELESWIDQSSHMEIDCLVLTIFKVNQRGMYVCHNYEQLKGIKYLNYVHNSKLYFVERFDEEWVTTRKEILLQMKQLECFKQMDSTCKK